MKLLVIDGQGGGVGKALVQALKADRPERQVLALGTNAAATAAMLRAGADLAATGEAAICYQCQKADIIVGGMGILQAHSMLGEISPAMAAAVSASPAQKVPLPMERCGLHVPGVGKQTLEAAIQGAVAIARKLCDERTESYE